MAVAKIAVSAATYWLDKPYDYLIPQPLAGQVVPGMRVTVPFGRGNRRSEGVVLAVEPDSGLDELKCVESACDAAPVLTPDQLKLALWMRDRFFCTVYDAVKTMLPAGMWFTADGRQKVGDKLVPFASLTIGAEDALAIAEQKRRKAPQQAELLRTLAAVGAVSTRELLHFTGASRQSFNALLRAELAEENPVEVFRRPARYEGVLLPLPELNDSQRAALDGLLALTREGEARAALLFGVTGSGKTAVYIHLIDSMLKRGRTSILLVPEIALTPQMLQTFCAHFGDEIAVLHSSLSVGERYDEWKRVKSGEARVVIGTRSAVFAPAEDPGLIIIDEEQEDTYKSENAPRYHARDVAKYLAARAKGLLLLGSATPDIESRYAAETGRYKYFALPERFNNRDLPGVKIVDMKRELRRGNGGDVSSVLRDEIAKNLERGEQSILFLNRRGANKLITCGECGYTYKCPRCSVSLTYHSANRRLMCHYCGYSRTVDAACPDCGGILSYVGSGTQKVEQELRDLFPGTEILRMDTDTVSRAGSHEVLLTRFREERIPIMVGTQMVTKGLNFENVTLVGVISADQSLYAGDYRAGERTFSLITQVVGRSGRGERPGRAVIQTFTPGNETILQAAAQDYESFYASEIQLRRLQNTPPFADLYAVTASGQDEAAVLRCCAAARDMLADGLSARADAVILGPAPLPVVKVNNRYRYRVNVSCRADAAVRSLISAVVIRCGTQKEFRGVSVYADNNPAD
ncbi:MAG TPA: primosomal protein N' [Oscillospiraceae bacterium]|nr:primosomal protein N' [Oscillospiraceae bacterium]